MVKPGSWRGIALAGALLGFLAVVFAAVGSHAIDMRGYEHSWEMASIIHLFHAATLTGLAALIAQHKSRLLVWAAWLLAVGTLIFSGSIYLHVIFDIHVPGLTPLGGLILMAGWLLFAVSVFRKV